MQKINFQNLPSTSTPLNATNLNQLQTNVENAIKESNPVGTIKIFAGSTAPTGYLICDGSAKSRTTYSELFSTIGTTYGSGNGSTTFNIPNLKGKVVVGLNSSDTDFDTLGETGGEKTHVLTTSEMPSHAHTFQFDQTSGSLTEVVKTGAQGSYGKATSSVGGGQAHNNLQPYMVLNYIIKY